MRVHWALKGTLLCNLTVACCIAPAFHKDLSLEDRCEISLSGFALVDIFRFLADVKSNDLGVPRGSNFLAAQTCYNMQGVALTIAAICRSKPATFSPWTNGFGRLSELSVEEMFSALRAQTGNSQLSARAYFQCSARNAMRTSRHLNKTKRASLKSSKTLTEEQFLGIGIAIVATTIV